MDRRQFGSLGLTAFAASVAPRNSESSSLPVQESESPFRYCLNTSTIRGQKLSIVEEVKIAAEAGYSGIEPWIGKIRQFVENGGDLTNLRQLIQDSGLTVESAIGFANWIVDDKPQRDNALLSARSDMELVAAIGGKRIAAAPAGTKTPIDLMDAALRYRELLKIGEEVGVVPQLELWGHSLAIKRLGELFFIATEAAHENACLLPDVYHIFKGGSDFQGLTLFNGSRIHVFHLNDYPAQPSREKMTDADRVYPGDGVAPIAQILKTLYATGFRGALSLELFNRELWEQDPLQVAKTGLAKMKACVVQAELN